MADTTANTIADITADTTAIVAVITDLETPRLLLSAYSTCLFKKAFYSSRLRSDSDIQQV